jgi:hypothetical protein
MRCRGEEAETRERLSPPSSDICRRREEGKRGTGEEGKRGRGEEGKRRKR